MYVRHLLRYLAPTVCGGCGVEMQDAPEPRRPEACAPEACGPDACKPEACALPGEASALCSACLTLTEAGGPAALYAYEGPLRDLVTRAKFRGELELAGRLARMTASEVRRRFPHTALVTTVPSEARRIRERGGSLSDCFARATAKTCGWRFVPRLVALRGSAPPQRDLDREARMHATAGRFLATRRALRWRDKHLPILVCDDVRTTGASLAATVAALHDAGFSRVESCAIAQSL